MTYYRQWKLHSIVSPRSLPMFYSLRQIAPESKFSHLLYLDVFEHIIPLALICQVLSQTQRWEKRERALNMVTVIIVIIAMGLLPYLSIAHVLQKIASGLRYVWPDPCMKLPGGSRAEPTTSAVGRVALAPLVRAGLPPTSHHPDAGRLSLRLAPDGYRQHGRERARHLCQCADLWSAEPPTWSCRLSASAWHVSARVRYSSDRRCPLSPASA
jgi:hypothetical protein